MDPFRIENFKRENPDESFPEFETLTPQEAGQIRKALAQQIPVELAGHTWVFAFTKYLEEISYFLEDVSPEEDDFDLSAVARSLGLEPNEQVYINWDDFTTIDRMSFSDLSRYFDYIWYPGPDDIEIFDDTFSWILSIRHHGSILLWKKRD